MSFSKRCKNSAALKKKLVEHHENQITERALACLNATNDAMMRSDYRDEALHDLDNGHRDIRCLVGIRCVLKANSSCILGQNLKFQVSRVNLVAHSMTKVAASALLLM
jgi:hypothetical protein